MRWGSRFAEGDGSACFIWLPSPGIDIEVQTKTRGIDLDSATLELPGFGTDNIVVHSVHTVPSPTHGVTSRIRAFASEINTECEQDIVSVGFQVANFMNFFTRTLRAQPGDPRVIKSIEQGSITGESASFNSSADRYAVTLSHDGWLINLVTVPNANELFKQLKATGGYAFTHVGHLAKTDGELFAINEAEKILDTLTAFLSFARGASVRVPIQWGRGVADEIVWRQFRSPVVDVWQAQESWFDRHHGEFLSELFDDFYRSFNSQELQSPLKIAMHWYCHSNMQSSGLEGSIILGMAALELLSVLIVVGPNKPIQAREHDNLGTAKKLRCLLQKINVPECIPPNFVDLTAFALSAGKIDSCDALTELRNGFVHSNERRRKIVFGVEGQEAIFDAWRLSLWYQELALLYLLGYQGNYSNRTTRKQVGQIEPVPWSLR